MIKLNISSSEISSNANAYGDKERELLTFFSDRGIDVIRGTPTYVQMPDEQFAEFLLLYGPVVGEPRDRGATYYRSWWINWTRFYEMK